MTPEQLLALPMGTLIRHSESDVVWEIIPWRRTYWHGGRRGLFMVRRDNSLPGIVWEDQMEGWVLAHPAEILTPEGL